MFFGPETLPLDLTDKNMRIHIELTRNVKQFAIVENPADIITKKRLKLKIKIFSYLHKFVKS